MRLSACAILCGAMLAAACTDQPINPGIQTGISGTRLEAEKVVRLVYRQEPASAIALLPYSSGNIAPAVERMRQRWPQLKPYLEDGSVGLDRLGLLRLHEPKSGADPALSALLRHENNDRAVLYAASRGDVGHGDDRIDNWSPTTELVFAEAWAAQAPAGWWVQDSHGNWRRKQAGDQPQAPVQAPSKAAPGPQS
jgi:hypothetical protein